MYLKRQRHETRNVRLELLSGKGSRLNSRRRTWMFNVDVDDDETLKLCIYP